MNRALKTSGKIIKGLTFVSLESQKKRHKYRKLWKNNDSKLSKFGERYEFTDPRSSANHKKGKLKENHDQIIIIKSPQTKD